MAFDPTSRLNRGGSSTADRLARRAVDRGRSDELSRRGVPGGDVFSGDLANRALKALGARAMTVDRSIIVSSEFDSSKPEDKALLAHEQFHLDHSSGVGENSGHDHEEVMARAIERMVLHQAFGGTESHEAQHAGPGQGGGHAGGVAHAGGNAQDQTDNPAVRGYKALRARGMSHQAVIDLLVKEIHSGMDAQREQAGHRMSDKKGFL